MSMNKKKYIILGLIIICIALSLNNSLSLFAPASNTTQYVAENACQENDIKRVLQIFGYLLLVAKIMVPLIIIGFGTFDLFKSVIDKDEKSLGKQVKQLGLRVLAGFIVFFIPNIVYAVFSLSDALDIIDTSEYKTCAECVLEPSKCNVN